MTTLFLFAILFICGLVNSYLSLVSPSKLFAWICTLLPLTTPTTTTQTKATCKANYKKEEKKEKEEEVGVDRVDLQSVFATFDHDRDGFVTSAELEESLRRLGLFASSREVMHIVSRVDANRDGLIDLQEFQEIYDSVAAAGDAKLISSGGGGDQKEEEKEEMEDLKEAFDVFDGNGDGVISAEELGLVLSSLGLMRQLGGFRVEEDCRDMIRKVDDDGDGMVNFDEFKKMMMMAAAAPAPAK